MIAQIIFNRNANAARKNPELIQTVYSSLKLDQDFLMTTSPEEILRSLDNEDNGGVLRLEIAIKTPDRGQLPPTGKPTANTPAG